MLLLLLNAFLHRPCAATFLWDEDVFAPQSSLVIECLWIVQTPPMFKDTSDLLIILLFVFMNVLAYDVLVFLMLLCNAVCSPHAATSHI